MDRVVPEQGGVVRIRVAAGQTEAPLPDERGEIVRDLPGLARLGEAGRQASGQAEFVVDRLEEDGTAIGALMGGVERGH